jgi:hypothetical protein
MVLVGKPEGKRPHVRPRRTWGDNITMVSGNGMRAWTGLIWLRRGTGGGHM